MKKSLLTFFLAALVLAGVAVGGAGFFYWDFTSHSVTVNSRPLIYELEPGKGFQRISKDLEAAGVIRNADFFSWYARLTGQRSHVKAGEYQLDGNMRPGEILSVLTSGKSIQRPFTVSEGLNIYDIAALYEQYHLGTALDFLAIVKDQRLAHALVGPDVDSLEGYLFPETYQFTKFTTGRELVTAMVKRFMVVYKDIEPFAKDSKLTRHQIVTLASIIEKETGAPVERPRIASIFLNRLEKRMRLQTDPTIIYGIADETGKVPTNIGKSDILRPTRYNTYVLPALPPGPIANPGREALMAAVKPDVSQYLYFVSRNDGTHIFSTTYQEHLKAVSKYQLDPKMREGKSWRDLKK